MKRFLLFVLLAFGVLSAPADAQQPAQAFILSSCGSLPAGVTYAASTYGIVTMDTTGKLCDGAGGGGNTVTLAPSSSSASGLSPSSTSALASSQIVKSGAGNLFSFDISADSVLSSAPWWIMIFNATSLPADGAVTPTKCYAEPAGAASASFGFFIPVQFSTGIVIGVSTTGCFTKTASVHAFISGDAQ